jgi:hypothetical protein
MQVYFVKIIYRSGMPYSFSITKIGHKVVNDESMSIERHETSVHSALAGRPAALVVFFAACRCKFIWKK